jgi:hypothetical protein
MRHAANHGNLPEWSRLQPNAPNWRRCRAPVDLAFAQQITLFRLSSVKDSNKLSRL